MQKIVTAPGGFGVMVIEEAGGRPTRDELAIRGDYPSKTDLGAILISAAVGLVALIAVGSFFV